MMRNDYKDIKDKHMVNTGAFNEAVFEDTVFSVRNRVYTELEIAVEESTLSAGNNVGLNTKSHFENRQTE